ncbi:hypothetical protein MRX96_017026 [Rhipicephalus microplus]
MKPREAAPVVSLPQRSVPATTVVEPSQASLILFQLGQILGYCCEAAAQSSWLRDQTSHGGSFNDRSGASPLACTLRRHAQAVTLRSLRRSRARSPGPCTLPSVLRRFRLGSETCSLWHEPSRVLHEHTRGKLSLLMEPQ